MLAVVIGILMALALFTFLALVPPQGSDPPAERGME
jgi:hypothetical protein